MLIDSNILVYSINSISPKYKRAQIFLQENLGNLDIAHQNILESIRILTHPKFTNPMKIKDALEAVLNIVKGCNVISPNYQTVYITLELIRKYKMSSDQVFDAYIAATAISNDIDTIATDNEKDFKKFSEITVHNPFRVEN